MCFTNYFIPFQQNTLTRIRMPTYSHHVQQKSKLLQFTCNKKTKIVQRMSSVRGSLNDNNYPVHHFFEPAHYRYGHSAPRFNRSERCRKGTRQRVLGKNKTRKRNDAAPLSEGNKIWWMGLDLFTKTQTWLENENYQCHEFSFKNRQS